MKRFLDQLPAIIIIIATTLLALGIGMVVIYVLTAFERRGRWDELSKPPGEIARLVTGDVDFVVVETDGGATYEVFCNDDEEDYPCLQEVEPPADVDPIRCDSQEFPPPTGQVKDRLLTCIGQEYIINTQYILREDGSLWQWKIEIYPYFQLARALGTFVLSIVVGLAAGLFLVAARRQDANS